MRTGLASWVPGAVDRRASRVLWRIAQLFSGRKSKHELGRIWEYGLCGRCPTDSAQSGDNWCGHLCGRTTNSADLKSSVMFVHRFPHLSTDHIVIPWEVPIEILNSQILVIATKNRWSLVRWHQVRTPVSTADAPVSPRNRGLPTAGVWISPDLANLRVCEGSPMALSSRARSTRASVFLARSSVVGSGRRCRCRPV